MRYLYELGIVFFRLVLFAVSPFNSKAALWIKGRKNILSQISKALEGKNEEKRVWIHVASLGEFEQGRPVIEAIKKYYPEYKIVLTFFSPSGYEIRKNYEQADYVFYLPEDTAKKAKKFIEQVRPQLSVFIKYEYWYNYLTLLKNNNIPAYMVSAIFRENHIFFKWYGVWYRKMLYKIEHFFVQNENSKRLLNKIGIKNVTISGDTRFDRVVQIAENAPKIPIIEKFKDNSYLLVAGSTWKPDEDIIIDYINNNETGHWKFIIAPHEVHESNIKRIEQSLKKATVKYSDAENTELKDKSVLIINNVGMLSAIYQYGTIAYIGGGFNSGIHNVLEPATFGLPVIFGTEYKKFQEAQDLVRLGGAFSIKNTKEFTEIMKQLITNKLIKEKGGVCKDYIEQKKGATAKIIHQIFN